MKTTKQLTLKETWLKLAEMWENPILIDGDAFVKTDEGHDLSSGLCGTLYYLRSTNKISKDVYDQIGKTIDEHLYSINHPYGPWGWPRTLEGAKMRVNFCREQAAKCE